MEVLRWICYIVAALVLLYHLNKKLFYYIDVDPYEYLELISYVEWRSGRDIRLEMMRRKKGRIDSYIFYRAMVRLEDAKLIERKYVLKQVHGFEIKEPQFRKTSGGSKKQDEHEHEKKAEEAGVLQPA